MELVDYGCSCVCRFKELESGVTRTRAKTVKETELERERYEEIKSRKLAPPWPTGDDSKKDDNSKIDKLNQDVNWLSKALKVESSHPKVDNQEEQTERWGRFSHIITSNKKSKEGIPEWNMSNLTIALYLLYNQKASNIQPRCIKGSTISDKKMVEEMIYNLDLAIWAYYNNPNYEAQDGMPSEIQIVKLVPRSGPLRPAYFIGIDTYNKLVIVGFRRTSTFSDFITDIVAISETSGPTHFGIAQAARWFLDHEMESLRHLPRGE
ncbi:uncharacterized protein LOC143598772 [Bidens hawaiensis]|uniref:uncharacterized protein LOC143598772 n=1 Tax=Bidens hawaiensis TaxID=980011 RepID=UPI00404A926D